MDSLILIVEDEADLAATLEYNLESEGYKCRLAFTGNDALAACAAPPLPDLVLLDLMLPDMSGTEVCRRLRADPRLTSVPVIMLTARGEEIDRVVGFEVGADDYVVKPYSVRELLLRIRAVLRRGHLPAGTVGGATAAEIKIGRLRADPEAHRAWVDDEELTLTALELRLLVTLAQRRGRVQSREQLLDDVWGIQAEVTTRTVDTHVKRVRQKLGPIGHYIETLRGVGYRFRDDIRDDIRDDDTGSEQQSERRSHDGNGSR